MEVTKFRAWDKNREAMIDPEDLKLNGNGLEAVSLQNCDDEESGWERSPEYLANIIVLQYIGKNDKNNQPICEGDIFVEVLTGVVTYESPEFWAVTPRGSHFHPNEDGEVIGNIYEDPEILRGLNE